MNFKLTRNGNTIEGDFDEVIIKKLTTNYCQLEELETKAKINNLNKERNIKLFLFCGLFVLFLIVFVYSMKYNQVVGQLSSIIGLILQIFLRSKGFFK